MKIDTKNPLLWWNEERYKNEIAQAKAKRLLPPHEHDFVRDRWSLRRMRITLDFLNSHFNPLGNYIILDLGTQNALGNLMKQQGFTVINTAGEDFDEHRIHLADIECDVTTAFEILEHLLNPYSLLKILPSKHLICSVPLRLWFTPDYKGKDGNLAGRHFHEFQQWQFLWLLDKAGWEVVATKKFTSPTFKPGLRTILRWFVPRYFLVYAKRK